MATETRAAVKKSVTIDPEVLDALSSERKKNLSATVNASLLYTAALDGQRQMVAEWEREDGPFTDEQLAPYLELAIRAQMEHLTQTVALDPA